MTTPFHPIIDAWFRGRYGEPTEPQRLGWPEIAAGRHTLIAAPTGSGKTMAAFLVCIDELLREALDGRLEDRATVLYISPLKALSNDIRRNLEGPLAEITEAAAKAGKILPPIRAVTRTGDTPAHERAKMLKQPPHILVTTPESLYLLLTSPSGRGMLSSVRTVIVDEIHALARDKRGSHLALSLERLEALCLEAPVRVGLSATQKPIDEIARFLVGARRVDAQGKPDCRIVDTGHRRALDLDIEVPKLPLSAVCSKEQWAELDDRLVELISTHRSTLVFVNTRRMAERVAHRLTEKLGEESVASHHGSLSKELRLDAEERLKTGKLKAIVATASLELGIDVGFIDLVCQLGSPRSIATFLQRVGRAGHRLGVIPKGRLFALTRDELLEGLALLRAIRQGRLDQVEMPQLPLDILEQQLVAEVAGREEASEDELFELARGAWPFRALARPEFDRIISLASEGIARGRKDGAYLHRDAIHKRLKARKGARISALTSGGAIPETADYRVVTADERVFVGTVNEDFAIESLPGDVFILGNTSWRISHVRGGEVVVSDAQGAAATVPFWLGEAPGRTLELSREVSDLRELLAEQAKKGQSAAVEWIKRECGVDGWAAEQAYAYVAAQLAAVGFVPTQKTVFFERFFDETGGMQLVVHSPFGARINRAWGLAMRKRFCRSFNFELQASADDNGVVLSLGVQHSFPLEQMFSLLKSEKAKDVLIQALLDAPMFQLRWRWNVTRALAVLRSRGGKKVPPPLQRFRADDLLTAVFPLQTACFEHRPPEVPIPDHPLVHQTVHDCLTEAMDVERWQGVLKDIEAGRIKLEARDTREPSPFSHAILNAQVYAFLDDAPLEERRARAVAVRRTLDPNDARDLAKLDPEAVARVREDAWPLVRNEDELHDVLMSAGAMPDAELDDWRDRFESLVAAGRAAKVEQAPGACLAFAAERLPVVRAAFPEGELTPAITLPAELDKPLEQAEADVALVRGRLDLVGPATSSDLAAALGLARSRVEAALATLELEGFALQGRYTEASWQEGAEVEWCERRLLARIHRLTLDGARKRVQPVPVETYWRFLVEHHHLQAGSRREGRLGLYEAVGQLQGFEAAAAAWETDLLPGRVEKYQPEWLDTLSFSGELAWGRIRPPRKPAEGEENEPSGAALTRVAPIALTFRDDLPWLLSTERLEPGARALSSAAQAVHAALAKQGALFFDDLAEVTQLLASDVRSALSELAALGLVTSDGFSALRGLVLAKAPPARSRSRWGGRSAPRAPRAPAGRWTLFPGRVTASKPDERRLAWAWQLLRRYGVLFRDLLAREAAAPSWWELVPVLRRLEARGEARGGRFVSGVAGEQYALPEAVEALRRPREGELQLVVVSASDPLNLAGILGAGPRVPAMRGNRLLLRDGKPVGVFQGGEVSLADDLPAATKEQLARALRLQVPSMRDAILAQAAQDLAAGRSRGLS